MRYGADYRRASQYELDYLITPELGGVADARNLWPQPFSRTPWNAYVKDALERLFHRLVCAGEIELPTAQREMASDWISAYKRYFKTETPLRDYDAAPLTALDHEFILSELEEVGLSPAAYVRNDGPTLLACSKGPENNSIGSHRPSPSGSLRFILLGEPTACCARLIAFGSSAIEIVRDSRLRECDFGQLTRRPVAEIAALRERAVSEPFPDGESYAQVVARIAAWLRDVRSRHQRRVLVVGHKGDAVRTRTSLNRHLIERSRSKALSLAPGWVYELPRILES